MEDEEIQRMEFINENIIEKGIDIEEISIFVKDKTGEELDSLTLDKLKNMVELFNTKDKTKEKDTKKEEPAKKKEAPKKSETEKPKEKEKEKEQPKKKEEKKPPKEKPEIVKDTTPIDYQKDLYTSEIYDFQTESQQKNKLLTLLEKNTLITINISDPKKESGGFFSKNVYSYRVQCEQLKSDVRRTYDDFEWFRNQLVIRYPLRLVPPVMKESILNKIGNLLRIENEEAIEQRKIRYLNKFINILLQKKIFRSSPVLHEFLSLDDERFKKYRKLLDTKKYELEVTLYNLLTLKGKIKCSITENHVEEANKMINKYSALSDIYSKLDSNINNIINDLNNLCAHMKEFSSYFGLLNDNLTQNNYKDLDNMKKNVTELKNIFNNWSNSIGKQSDFFNKYFKESLSYMTLETSEMDTVYKKYIEFKKEYEEFTALIHKKKESLYNSQNYEKWDVHPIMKDDINSLKLNKKLAFENMLYKESILLSQEKKRVFVAIFKMNKQFDKLLKMHDERIHKMYDSMKKSVKIDFDFENDVEENFKII